MCCIVYLLQNERRDKKELFFFMTLKEYHMAQTIAAHNTAPSCLNILWISGTPVFWDSCSFTKPSEP